MAGCSKKQYAIMMSAGQEGKKLASEMGSMDQDKFNEAFSALLDSGAYKPQDNEDKYSQETDEDYGDFDADSEDDYGFDDENELSPEDIDAIDSYIDDMKKDNVDLSSEADVKEYLTDVLGVEDEDLGSILSYMEQHNYFDDSEPDDKNHMSYEEIFTDNSTRLIEKYAKHYGVDAEKLKDTIHQNALDRIRKGDSVTNARNDAMEEELDKLEPGSEAIDENEKTYHFEESNNGESPVELTIEGIKNAINANLEGEPTRENVDNWLKGAGLVNDSDRNEVLDKLGYKSEGTDNSDGKLSKYDAEDFEDARFYPSKSLMDENNRWIGRYHSIHEAFDGKDIDDFGNGKFKSVGDYKGTSIYQLPDGYYSINPRITSMSFKTKEALQDYLDKKNPEEHKYGLYWDGDIQRDYRGKDENGKEYGMEGPDAYKAARKARMAEERNNEWRLKPENLAIVQDLQKLGLDTASMTEEDFNVAREIFRRYGKPDNKKRKQ